MKIDLSGKVLLITGAARGIGGEIARAAADAGARDLFLVDRDFEPAGDLPDTLRAQANVETLTADLAEPDAPARVTDACVKRFGRIDGLVNAAGLTDRASFLDGTAAGWDSLMAVNARAPFFLMQGAIRDMTRRVAPGAIVNIVSVNAHCGDPDLAIYSASKGALATLTKNAANAHLADRIRVNGINVGWCDTPGERRMQAETLGKGPGWLAAAETSMPLGRLLQADEVARLCIYLLSDASGLQTGTITDLDQRVLGATR